jgi:predicted GTPase
MDLLFNIASFGHPNVGKNRLFNNLSHKRISIVHDVA